MSWRSAFEAQWTIFLAVVEAKLRREIHARGRVSVAGANAMLAGPDCPSLGEPPHTSLVQIGTPLRGLGAEMRGAAFQLRIGVA
jgi:hypothetical protein